MKKLVESLESSLHGLSVETKVISAEPVANHWLKY